ncbi:MAG TPA: (d)CMP kinase [Planctomycetota bacterium]|nr:(d)CMP kinase [Planctomycetota bacterium]
MSDRYIITIDGPAGSGKTTAARGLARRLGVKYFSSGALYRAIAWLGMRHGIDLDDTDTVLERLRSSRIALVEADGRERVCVDGEDVTDALSRNTISLEVHRVADPPAIRAEVGRLAHELNAGRSFVTEGRDQGTEVFPEATVKFYLDARPEVRAERRRRELESRGERVPAAKLLDEILERDRRDRERKVGALRMADDAVRVDNSDLDCDETVERLYDICTSRLEPT